MPYDSASDVPAWVRKRGSDYADKWRAVFNSAMAYCKKHGKGDCEAYAFKVAAAEAKKAFPEPEIVLRRTQ